MDREILDSISNARKVRENFMNLFIIGNGFDLYHGLPTQYRHFVEYMKKNFPQEYGWLEEIEPYIKKNSSKEWLVNLFKKDECSILSFNYTMTIEQVYHLPVFHVHGKKGGKLIMGHGNGDGGDIIGEDFGINVINQKFIRKYFRETYKNPRRIMKKYSDYFEEDNLKRVKTVYVLGHSLNYIDMPYIESICCHMDSKVKWEIAYYNDDDRIYYQEIMKKIAKKNADYELMSWRNFEDRYNLQ